MRTTSPLELVWGSALTPRRVPGTTGQNVGYKKIFCSLRSQIIRVPTFKFVAPPLFVLIILIALKFGQLILGKIIIAKHL